MKRGIAIVHYLFVATYVVVCLNVCEGETFPSMEMQITSDPDHEAVLYLTPLIEAGNIMEAQHLSKVRPDIGNMTSFSGFLTTNKTCGNNLFFWFFPAQEDWSDAPLVLWLNGGPGTSSMLGLFTENGPFNHFSSGLVRRKYSWNVKNNLLFVDQPVGTGYSFTEKGCYVTDQTGVGENMYSALVQFLQLFPTLQKNKFIITGESDAGHFIPAIGFTIHKKNPTAKLKINLAGMMIGDGWIDPREQINYADYLYQLGLVDDNERDNMRKFQEQFVQQIDSKMWFEAALTYGRIQMLYLKYTGNLSKYNYLLRQADQSDWKEYITTAEVRQAIHVGDLAFNDDSLIVHFNLAQNDVQSVKPWVEALLDHGYPMVFYVGQLDVTCAYPMVVNFLRSLNWTGRAQYLNATRMLWHEGGEVAGYIKVANNMADVLVRGAGHMVPSDQPFWAYQLVNRFTSGGIPGLVGHNFLTDK